MLEHFPWGKSATEVEPKLEAWVRSWTKDKLVLLEPIDWFEKGHDVQGGLHDDIGFWPPVVKSGLYLWTPPPAAADVCLEQIRIAQMKRKNSVIL